jgi:transposase
MITVVRDRLVRAQTQLSNAIRGHASEFGLVAAKGLGKIEPLLARVAADESLPALARRLFAELADEYAQLQARLASLEAELRDWRRQDEAARRLIKIPGVGPVGAPMLALKTPDPAAFASGRDFAAWLGLTPKDHSTAGKLRLGAITKAGDEALRAVLVAGAMSMIKLAVKGQGSPWLVALVKRKAPKLAAVALANKIARIAWKLMVSGEDYDPKASGALRVATA